MIAQIRPAISIFILLTIVTGVIYPLAVCAVGQVAFADKANGSIITVGGVEIGSRLIGQTFTSPKYFWGRPSATSPTGYNAEASSGSNYGPNHPAQHQAVQERIAALHSAGHDPDAPVPVDLVTASASGLDPDISLDAAYYQAERVAAVRGIPVEQVNAAIERHAKGRLLGFFGEPRVNVLELNLDLDGNL